MKTDITKTKAYRQMPTTKSSDVEWLNWMALLNNPISGFGRNQAATIFLTLWEKRGSSNANTIQLRKKLKDDYNLEIDESAWHKVADLGGGIADTLGGFAKVSKIVTLTVGVIVIGGLAMIVFNIAKNPIKAASTILRK